MKNIEPFPLWEDPYSNSLTGTYKMHTTGNIISFKNGKFHNETGPAVITIDNDEYYYLEGECYSKAGWLKTQRTKKLKTLLNK